ncbi:MAG: hypothetical protein GY754_02805 [bacterium]|nr:hypothetical protein [bacterium]
MRFDIHVHSLLSPCSTLEFHEILSTAGARNLDGICITDHNTLEARNFIREGRDSSGLILFEKSGLSGKL